MPVGLFGFLSVLTAEQIFISLGTLLCPPLFLIVLLILILTVTGKSLGIRKAYVNLLLKVFDVSYLYIYLLCLFAGSDKLTIIVHACLKPANFESA